MNENNKLNIFHYHETLERTYLITGIVSEYLNNNVVINNHKQLKSRIEKAVKLLAETYTIIGGLEYSLFPDELKNTENENEIKNNSRRNIHTRRKK